MEKETHINKIKSRINIEAVGARIFLNRHEPTFVNITKEESGICT